jgi:hypothetical protein
MADNGWGEWKNLVLEEIRSQKKTVENMQKTLESINVDIARLKIKAGIWGTIGGAIVIGISILIGALTGVRWGI